MGTNISSHQSSQPANSAHPTAPKHVQKMGQGWLRKTSSSEAAAGGKPAGTWPAVGLSWFFKLSQYLSLQKWKSCEACGFQIPLSIESKLNPETFFSLHHIPMPSADERKGRSLGPQTSSSSSSSHRDQPSGKEMSTAYLHCRKQTQPLVEKHRQSPRETQRAKPATLHQTSSVLVA